MKTLLNFLLMFALAVTARAATEPDPAELDANNQYQTHTRTFGVGVFPKKGAPVINLLIDNYSNKGIVVTLKDSKGNVYYMDMLGKRKRRTWLKFNMRDMQDAAYQVVVHNGTDKVVKEINLSTVSVPLPQPQLAEQRLISMR